MPDNLEGKVFITLSFVLVPSLGTVVVVPGSAPFICLAPLKKPLECLRKLLHLLILDAILVTPDELKASLLEGGGSHS